MRLADASYRFQEVLRAGPGVKLFGQITNMNTGDQSLENPTRILLVDQNSAAKSGMEVTSAAGFRYLLADNDADYQAGVVKKSFLMIRLDRQGWHTRHGSAIDPVTGLELPDTSVLNNEIWYQARSAKLAEAALKIPEASYTLITGADIREGDRVDSFTILHVDKRFGVNFAEAA